MKDVFARIFRFSLSTVSPVVHCPPNQSARRTRILSGSPCTSPRFIEARNSLLIQLIPLFIILVFGLVGVSALFHPGFYTSHDGEHQLVRQYVFDRGLWDGQIPVRVSRQLYNGYGYPLFVFTYRLPFYIGEVFRFMGFPYVDAVKTTFAVTYLLSGFSMFIFAKRVGLLSGTIAAILYLWAPYRFSVMFVRASLGEHVALLFIPLLFWSIDAMRMDKKRIIIGGLSLAGLFLSHAMITQIVLLILPCWIIGHAWVAPHRLKFFTALCGLIFLGFAFSAHYMVPAFFYKQFIQKLNPYYFADHFVTLRQLLYSPWGYAFSMKGTGHDGMSFQIGIAQWIVIVTAMMSLVGCFLKRTVLQVHLGPFLTHITMFLIIFFFSVFLMTEKSIFAWNSWRNIVNIDMPWRFLSMAVFMSASLAGWMISILNKSLKIVFFMILVAAALYGNRNHIRVNKYIDYSDEALTFYQGTSNSDNEYRPVWDDKNITNMKHEEAVVSQGAGVLKIIRSSSNFLAIAVKNSDEIRLDINTLYFPGWTISVDGRVAPFKYRGEGGIMRVDVPSGYHMVEASYKETTLMKLADGISLSSVIWLGIEVKQWKKRKK